MAQWTEKIIKKAEQAQLSLELSNPEKLINYFITNFIQPLENEVTKINKDFYSINQKDTQTNIKIVNEEILITIEDDIVRFFKLNETKNSWNVILRVVFENSIPKVKRDMRDSHLLDLIKDDFEYVMFEVFK